MGTGSDDIGTEYNASDVLSQRRLHYVETGNDKDNINNNLGM